MSHPGLSLLRLSWKLATSEPEKLPTFLVLFVKWFLVLLSLSTKQQKKIGPILRGPMLPQQ